MDDTVHSFISIYVIIPYFLEVSLSESAVCSSNSTDQGKCCTDFRNISGKCEACIGSWGKDCANSCNYGFFGHGCRQECNCSEQLQICDSKIGCTDRVVTEDLDRTEKLGVLAIFILVTCLLAFFLFGSVIYFYFFKEKRGQYGPFRRGVTTHAMANNLQNETEYANYNDIRESYFIDRDCLHVTSTFRISKKNSQDCHQMNIDENPSKQATSTPSLSKHMSPTEYKSCFEELDGYSRLELRSQVCSSVIRNMNRLSYSK